MIYIYIYIYIYHSATYLLKGELYKNLSYKQILNALHVPETY